MSYENIISFYKHNNLAYSPKKEVSDSVGLKLFTFDNVLLKNKKITKCSIEIGIIFPENYYGRLITPMVLLSNNIQILNPIISKNDSNDIKIILKNFSGEDILLFPGDHIATLLIEQNHTPNTLLNLTN